MKLLILVASTLISAVALSQMGGGGAWGPHPGRPMPPRPMPPPHRPPPPDRPMPPRPPRPVPPPPSPVDSEDIFLGRWLTNEAVDLSRMLMGRAQGRQIESVILWSNSPSMAVVSLRTNGWEDDSTRADRGGVLELRTRNASVVGRDRIELLVNGQIYADRITVRLARGGYPPGPNQISLPVYVNQTVSTGSVISVERLINLNAYRGYRIDALSIEARNLDRGVSRADVLVNGRNVGSILLNGYGPSSEVYVNQMISGMDRIELRFAGYAAVDRVWLRLSR